MKVLRLVMHQSSANYRKAETIENKMTYPLPPLSTVIGAIHSACGFTDYKDMDISIQGKYESMHREPYTDYCFLNNVQDDRGILVKMKNENLLSPVFEKVAGAKKPTGNSFRKNITIQVYNQSLLEEYQTLKDLNDEIDKFKKERLDKLFEIIKRRKKILAEKKKNADYSDRRKHRVITREKEIKEVEKIIKERFDKFKQEKYALPIFSYRSLTTSLKYYEILNNVELVIHIKAEEEILNIIYENRYKIKSIGRSEDMVHLLEAKMVNLIEEEDCNIRSDYSAYIGYQELQDEYVYPGRIKSGQHVRGTKYYLNKKYEIEGGKRLFREKKKVVYISKYEIDGTSDTVLIDREEDKEYIVNLL